jgi:predicted transposase/invertase (TIGR01784 family)
MNSEQSHDKFFKETFSRTDITADFLQACLPGDIHAKLDLSSLRRKTDSHTDEQLNEHFADLIFSILCDGKPIRITLLLEHKSYPVKYPHFQLNRYLLNVWEQQIRQKNKLTPILPIIIYHGQSRWQKRPLSAYFPGIAIELTTYLPAFDYVLIDLGAIETMLP